MKRNKKEVRKNYAFYCEPSKINKVDYYAAKMGMTRSLMIRNMIDTSLDDLKVFEKTGALMAIKKSQNFISVLKNPLSEKNGVVVEA